jgi:hypothetical protein
MAIAVIAVSSKDVWATSVCHIGHNGNRHRRSPGVRPSAKAYIGQIGKWLILVNP